MMLNLNHFKSSLAMLAAVAFATGQAEADYIDTLQNTSGLVSHWSLEETSGTTAADSVAGFDGFNTGSINAGKGADFNAAGPRPSDGFIGFSATNSAIDFAGGAGGANNTSPYVDTDHQGLTMDPSGYTGASGLNEATMIVWFRITDSTEQHYHLGGIQRDSSDGSGGRYGLTLNHYDDANEGLRLFSRVGDPEQSSSTSNGATPDYYAPASGPALWHMAVATLGNDGLDKTMKLYVDGVLYDTETSAGNAALNLSPRDAIIFGHDADLDNGRQMVGQLDEIAMFNRALSATEISALYGSAFTELVPEPSSIATIGLGLAGLAIALRRKK